MQINPMPHEYENKESVLIKHIVSNKNSEDKMIDIHLYIVFSFSNNGLWILETGDNREITIVEIATTHKNGTCKEAFSKYFIVNKATTIKHTELIRQNINFFACSPPVNFLNTKKVKMNNTHSFNIPRRAPSKIVVNILITP